MPSEQTETTVPAADTPPEVVGRPRRGGGATWRDTFAALKHRNFRLFFVGQLVSLTGTWMNKPHKVHRLIFLLEYGYLPKEIDHINGDRQDNRIENLREVTRSQNQFNKTMCKNNTSGTRGVSWHQKSGSWVVRVCANGKSKSIGYFKDLELAGLVADEARAIYHGVYAK